MHHDHVPHSTNINVGTTLNISHNNFNSLLFYNNLAFKHSSMASSSSLLVFKVKRKEPQLIAPAAPTPYEFKYLSDIDDQKGLRFQVPFIIFYRNVVGLEGRDPVKVIREGIAKALVYYYPLAGRLREGPNAKLMVECNGEGVMFIEADANVMLDQFGGEVLQPPFPCMEDLLYDVPGSSGILNCPLLLIQVTRLLCGGFIVAIRLNHAMCDGPGLIQFLTAVNEMGVGASVPSIRPIWKRELLSARNPPQVSCEHHIYQELPDSKGTPLLNDMVQSSFFFTPQDIAFLRSQVPPHLRKSSRFEIITAFLWRCRTMALSLNPNDEVRLVSVVNSRTIFNPPLPIGFYGNAGGLPVAVSSAGKLCQNPLGYALELVKKAKADCTEEFMRSTADLLVKKGRLQYVVERTYIITDVTRVGFTDIDFGWGKPVYSGPTGAMPMEASFFIPLQNKKGENVIVVTINLPAPFMNKFIREIDEMIKEPSSRNMSFIRSSL